MKSQIKKIENYIPEEPIESVKKRLGLDKLVRLSANENPFGTSPKVKEAILNWNFGEENRYPDGYANDLRNKIADFIGVVPEKLVFGVGLDEIITMISRIFLEAGDEVILSKPTFSEYALHAQIEGAKVIEVPCLPENGHYDFEGFLKQITDKTKVIWICNPNNPTGTYEDVDTLKTFFDSVPDNILILLDEAYIHYVTKTKNASFLSELENYKNVMLLRTFSKAYGLANYRVGYAVMDEKLANYMQAVRLPYNLNSLAQVAAIAALSDQDFVNNSVEKTQIERDNWENFFKENKIKYYVSQANFIFFNYPDANKLADELLKNGYQIRRGLLKNWLRVTIGSEKDGDNLRSIILKNKEI
ncbi:histidinol-phosphate transaminase [Liquorilactobacillus mali]|uniref:Histidinol-phosphate aminotransferase n=1 Tax=Liquorilactobacillus mali KCTC 3596 = DSM 20444 TaxID=1046596 RepID=J1F578_9LACO|nr:histidinol-phosphate transaminase [Liquorilactobacillus mali]EJF01436.1 histidinol-phosphate aminotransferase [Liquorilactobacillus mali KCTC 3596 = DSM 20444]KRN10105.1 histidinol-phosphate aminotransferase [Liquorilactobacillus mali KCTC 3596 = DSM 20444]MDC7953850.1 histidinol-phosphate transaminase [Liquorilactobacillus mali]QFQ75195.1 histidinol-phosphate transaminase [Liquorilactobacillus mali]